MFCYFFGSASRVKSVLEHLNYNAEIHEHVTNTKSDFQTSFRRSVRFNKSPIFEGVALFNSLPEDIRSANLSKFKTFIIECLDQISG